jgi:glycosyltransferase involved in cell wall biosynthesis
MDLLSAVIITFNEEKNISRCLQSLEGIADEIVVVDSGSTDRTKEICKEFGVRFMVHEWPGYTEQKNYANAQASYNFVLSLDADEAISGKLRENILKEKENGLSPGYLLNRMTNYCGHWIRHGAWYPDPQLRLFDRRKGKWVGERIHESFELNDGNAPVKLKGDIHHYSYYTIGEHVAQANRFTTITAEVAHSRGKRAGLLRILFSPVARFLRDYIFKGGFLDGYHGFLVAQISANATFLKYTKLKQLNQQSQKLS